MPLVRIDSPTATAQQLTALGDAVHDSLVSAIGIPADDRFQVIRGGGDDLVRYHPSYLGVSRDDGVVFVQVFLRRGRTNQQKRDFYAALAERAADAGVEPRNLLVVLTENDLGDWSFGEGVAQYLDNPPPGVAVPAES